MNKLILLVVALPLLYSCKSVDIRCETYNGQYRNLTDKTICNDARLQTGRQPWPFESSPIPEVHVENNTFNEPRLGPQLNIIGVDVKPEQELILNESNNYEIINK